MKKPYAGIERRRQERRISRDRRNMIRFEIDTEPRRQILDRRTATAWNSSEIR